MNKLKIKKGDQVMVISGKDKGKTGKVERVMPASEKLVLDNANMIKRHMKPGRNGQSGRIIERPAPIHVSNVMLLDPDTQKPTRVGRRVQDGTIVRYAKKSGSVLK